MASILVIEDDRSIREALVEALTLSGHDVQSAPDGRAGLDAALRATYHVLLLDLVLPHHSGFQILEALKKVRPGQPVIILSARGEEADRVKGLHMGADDYVVKPFSLKELLARVDAVLRRTTERPAVAKTWSFPGGCVDLASATIQHTDGSCSEMSEKENELLRYLVSQGGRVVSREELLVSVWRLDPNRVETRTIDVHIAHLRSKLRDSGQDVLLTIRGRGYKLCQPA